MKKKQIAVLVSGSGTNLQAIIKASRSGSLEAKISVIISNKKNIYAERRAKKASIPYVVFDFESYCKLGFSRMSYDLELVDIINLFKADLIVLAGWMHILNGEFLDQFPNKVINLHPALPGEFPGANAIQEAWNKFKQKKMNQTGVMIHWAVPEVDAGEPILVAKVPMKKGDSFEKFKKRLHSVEHRLIVQAIKKILKDQN